MRLLRSADEVADALGYAVSMKRLMQLWTWIDRRPQITDAAISAVFVILARVETHVG